MAKSVKQRTARGKRKKKARMKRVVSSKKKNSKRIGLGCKPPPRKRPL